MTTVFKGKEGNKVSFSFEIGVDEFNKSIQKVYLENRSMFNIPGFRKGKAPRQIIEMNYGKEIFYEDALNEILPEKYGEAVEELELEPVDQPDVDIDEIKKGNPILVKVEVEVKPEVKLGDYKSIELEKIEYNVKDEMIEEELKSFQEQNARLIDADDREVKEGDLLTIDFEGYVDGEQFSGGSAEDHQLEIGSNTFIPGFEDQLIGKNKDEEVEVNVEFPEDYQEESLAGKEAIFKVNIKDIKEKQLPELDDDLAIDVSEFDTLKELKEDIKERLEKELKEQEKVEKENKVIEKAVEMSEMDVPEAMIEAQIDDEVRQFDFRLRNQGLELEKYLEMTGASVDDLREQFKPNAEMRVNADLVLEAIAKEENIQVDDEDIDKELEKMAEQYESEDKDEFIEQMKKGDLEFLRSGITNNKVIELLIENTKFN